MHKVTMILVTVALALTRRRDGPGASSSPN